MSGGHFDYDQYRITGIADEMENIVKNNDCKELDDWGCEKGRGYCPEVIEKFKEGVRLLREAQVYAQRADWLLSCDDGEEAFLRRLAEDLEKERSREVADPDECS